MSPRTDETMIRVFGLVADDVVREGVLSGVARQPDMSVVGQAVAAGEALPVIADIRPDVALVDAHLRDRRGVEACPAIREVCPSIACLLMASMADERTLVEGAVAGAATVVPKQLRGFAVIDAIRAVVDGARLFDFPANRLALARLGGTLGSEPSWPLRSLLELMADGRDREAIAAQLGISRPDADALVDRLLVVVGLRPTEYPN